MKYRFLIAALFFIVPGLSYLNADVYRWTDSKGNVIFGNLPPSDAQNVKLMFKESTSGPDAKPAAQEEDQSRTEAIIQDLDHDRQDMVSVGSVVAGARVVSIAKDRVVLNVSGREEILVLGAEGTRPASTRDDQGAKESATSTYVLDRETVRENLDDLPSLLMQARAELYLKEGRPEGFQLSQIQKGSILKSVGFQDGDVIRSVNGQEVRSLEDAIALYQKFGDGDSFTIGILRGEKPKTLHVKIR
jgi:type II secretion system protein C